MFRQSDWDYQSFLTVKEQAAYDNFNREVNKAILVLKMYENVILNWISILAILKHERIHREVVRHSK